MKSVRDLPIFSRLLSSTNPTVRYKANKLLLDRPEDSREMISLRSSIAGSAMARRLLGHRRSDGTINTNPYKKWQGPHWTLYSLAQIEYPPGDRSLLPLRDQIYDWLFEERHLKFPRSLLIPGQESRFRRCASQEANAIWYSIRLGIEDERTKILVERLKLWQWPDGGWNCDKRPEARTSSVIESLVPLRALDLAARAYHDDDARRCADRTAEFFLARNLGWRRHGGKPILSAFERIAYPIQFYDVLFALLVIAETGRIEDPRCGDALDLLMSKQLTDGGFPVERKNCHAGGLDTTNGSFADWGPSGKRISNPLVSVDALYVLKSAGRLE